jgi:hypothetical protein
VVEVGFAEGVFLEGGREGEGFWEGGGGGGRGGGGGGNGRFWFFLVFGLG